MGAFSSPGMQAVTADDLHSQDVLSPRREPTGDAGLDLSQPAEEDVRRGEGIESSGPVPVPQQEMSLRDLASPGSASQPASDDMGEFDQEPPISTSTGTAEQASSDGTPSQLSFFPQQQQQQLTQQLRPQPSGNPFQAAAMAADAPAGVETFPGRFTGIPTAASTTPVSPDNPFASPAAPDDARQPLVGDGTVPGRDVGPGALSGSQSGVVAIPHQQSGTLSVSQESTGLQVQAEQAAGPAVAGSLHLSRQGSHGNAVSVPRSSMHTATSIAELLADLPPAGMCFPSM